MYEAYLDKYGKRKELEDALFQYKYHEQYTFEELKHPELYMLKKILSYKPSTSSIDLAPNILKEKLAFQKLSLQQILLLIKERENLKQRHISEIQERIMNLQSELFLHKLPYAMFIDTKRKNSIEASISRLEEKLQQEETACWQDTSRLRQNLVEIAADYKAIERRSKLLS